MWLTWLYAILSGRNHAKCLPSIWYIYAREWYDLSEFINISDMTGIKTYHISFRITNDLQHLLLTESATTNINERHGSGINFFLDVITNPCHNFNGGLTKPPLMLWHELIIATHQTNPNTPKPVILGEYFGSIKCNVSGTNSGISTIFWWHWKHLRLTRWQGPKCFYANGINLL